MIIFTQVLHKQVFVDEVLISRLLARWLPFACKYSVTRLKLSHGNGCAS